MAFGEGDVISNPEIGSDNVPLKYAVPTKAHRASDTGQKQRTAHVHAQYQAASALTNFSRITSINMLSVSNVGAYNVEVSSALM
jgi:hypothetical protein